MISYKVIALILEPYRKATSSQAAIKTSETTNPQPDHLENVDVEYESFDQYEEESENIQKPQDEEKGQELLEKGQELSENEQELQNEELQENGDEEQMAASPRRSKRLSNTT